LVNQVPATFIPGPEKYRFLTPKNRGPKQTPGEGCAKAKNKERKKRGGTIPETIRFGPKINKTGVVCVRKTKSGKLSFARWARFGDLTGAGTIFSRE